MAFWIIIPEFSRLGKRNQVSKRQLPSLAQECRVANSWHWSPGSWKPKLFNQLLHPNYIPYISVVHSILLTIRPTAKNSTLLRFHLDRADCGSIPKGFHTCPWQFMHIATTVYRASISYFFCECESAVSEWAGLWHCFLCMSLRLLRERCSIIGHVMFWSYLAVLGSCWGEGFSIKTWPRSM